MKGGKYHGKESTVLETAEAVNEDQAEDREGDRDPDDKKR